MPSPRIIPTTFAKELETEVQLTTWKNTHICLFRETLREIVAILLFQLVCRKFKRRNVQPYIIYLANCETVKL